MSITGTSCHRGTASILGTLVFVGIIFTSFIPMMLLMNQADMLYDMNKHEMEILGVERTSENIVFYTLAQKLSGQLPTLSFIIENRGESVTTIERIWINNEPKNIGEPISSMNSYQTDPFEVDSVDESYIIKLDTDRGNVFLPSSGIPTYNIARSEWQMDSFTIFIMMTDPKSQLHVLVTQTKDGLDVPLETPITYFDNDVENNQPGYSISVPIAGTYFVEVTRWHGTPSVEPLGSGSIVLGLSSPTGLLII